MGPKYTAAVQMGVEGGSNSGSASSSPDVELVQQTLVRNHLMSAKSTNLGYFSSVDGGDGQVDCRIARSYLAVNMA